jgi:thioredoxin-like negative regulator of GroEL
MLWLKKRANLQVNRSLEARGELRPGDSAENATYSLPELFIDPVENPTHALRQTRIDLAGKLTNSLPELRKDSFVAARCCGVLRGALVCIVAWAWVWAGQAWCQENGSQVNMYHGNGAEISVTVHDESGEPISEAAMVRIYRDGNAPSGQSSTSRGTATFIVTTLGEFTVVVEAAGYQRVQKEISVPVPTKAQVDIYLRRDTSAKDSTGVPGRPLLAPKAKEALEKGLEALGADKLGNAEKYVGEARRLAPGHPDVLYVEGVLYLKQRKWTQAQEAMEKATQADPNDARAFAGLGMALSDQGKYEAAIAPLETALKQDAAVGWETHWALAKAYYHAARYEEALKTSLLAVEESNGKAPQIELLVAQALTAVGRYEEAAQRLREFLKEHGERPEAATARSWLERLVGSGKIQR